jgi:hypothetical protein
MSARRAGWITTAQQLHATAQQLHATLALGTTSRPFRRSPDRFVANPSSYLYFDELRCRPGVYSPFDYFTLSGF